MAKRVRIGWLSWLAVVLACAVTFTGCGATALAAEDLMADISPTQVSGKGADDAFVTAQTAFAVQLLQACVADGADENILLSPLSVQMALSMTANGAKGDTLSEMEAVLGDGMPISTLNEYWYTVRETLSDEWHLANSIWFKSDVERAFLQTNADYYDAAAYKTAFNEQTVADINEWVKTHTDGMIDRAVDRLDPSTVMFLVNALSFDAQWETKYAPSAIFNGSFTTADGIRRAVKMMSSHETTYLKDDHATGFIKPYAGGRYAFAAVLPNRDVSLTDYVAGLTADGVRALLDTETHGTVTVNLPQFSVDYDVTLNAALARMGMPTAFTEQADFSGISNRNLCIDEVIHKTHIEVDENGTKAGAITSVGIKNLSIEQENTVILDRPFLYMIVDLQTGLPAFIGTVTDI